MFFVYKHLLKQVLYTCMWQLKDILNFLVWRSMFELFLRRSDIGNNYLLFASLIGSFLLYSMYLDDQMFLPKGVVETSNVLTPITHHTITIVMHHTSRIASGLDRPIKRYSNSFTDFLSDLQLTCHTWRKSRGIALHSYMFYFHFLWLCAVSTMVFVRMIPFFHPSFCPNQSTVSMKPPLARVHLQLWCITNSIWRNLYSIH